VDRAFKIFDKSGKNSIDIDEYTETLSKLTGNNTDAAIKFLFDIYDDNGTRTYS
jgi:Ca2+-binding EF-hand superfamily protein